MRGVSMACSQTPVAAGAGLYQVNHPSRDDWNRFVTAQPGATIYQSYEWGEIRRSHGWEPHYIALTQDGEWVAAALVLAKRLPGSLGSMLYSPRGPIMTAWKEAAPALGEAVGLLARQWGAIFWRIEPPVQDDDLSVADCVVQAGFLPVDQEWSYWNRPKYEMKLNIAPGEAAVFAGLGTKIRTKVRHASKRGVLIEEGYTEQDMESFYRLLKNTGEKKRIPIRGLDYFHSLYRTLIKSGMARLVLARKDGTPVAGGMTVRYGTTATLLYLSNDYSMQRAGWAVQWEMLSWAMAQGCTLYDFGGTGTGYPPQETDKGYGVYQFK
ncbi:MAG TPA: peptidoglycan bridge formation glycyltransferase FemA/FemB family protein, partial [Nitrospiraceae bacterium]|nr:peptidoglycan bridge formation glycyltransferase FemA/FemB family protein [Nitrospiraceae bacterium]